MERIKSTSHNRSFRYLFEPFKSGKGVAMGALKTKICYCANTKRLYCFLPKYDFFVVGGASDLSEDR
jgi:hypothetical protein